MLDEMHLRTVSLHLDETYPDIWQNAFTVLPFDVNCHLKQRYIVGLLNRCVENPGPFSTPLVPTSDGAMSFECSPSNMN